MEQKDSRFFQKVGKQLSDSANKMLRRLPDLAGTLHSGRGTSDKSKSKVPPGQDTLDRFIEEAKFEVEHDCYRGIFGDEENMSPWKSCWFGSRLADSMSVDLRDDLGEMIYQITHCDCPCIHLWTREALKKSNKSKKRKKTREFVLGQRPRDPNYRCECDYNPFCLASLGGVMDEVFLENLDKLETSKESDCEVICLDQANTDTGRRRELDPFKPNNIYKETTAKMLQNIRRSSLVDEEPIRQYLERTLQGLTTVISIDECILRLRRMHQSVIFSNPLLDQEVPAGKIEIALPPGIKNLGATCYLNTQLQCLAQNTIFLDGIFSWQQAQDDNERMSKVIALLQRLLAEMKAGPSATLETHAFSDALGLDPNEQQDPNEFSRLLFHKMQEFFKGLPRNKEKNDNNGDHSPLTELLPHLFEGLLCYETTCLNCKNVSSRSETFMDITLPIVTETKNGQQSLLEAFQSAAATDVQFCLDRYLTPEKMDGDNQYFCSKCDCKRDATRSVAFHNLPPILNIQLCRYVYDRAKGEKKKMDEKVLLPLEIKVESKSKEREQESMEYRYLLCAVMNHKGKSAYRGHYIAEAMDWMTGQWFEFNDEKVTLLESGPKCSFDLSIIKNQNQAITANGRKKPKLATPQSGSEDAYNMYYVDEHFLAECVLDHYRSLVGARGYQSKPSPLESAAIDRSNYYARLSV